MKVAKMKRLRVMVKEVRTGDDVMLADGRVMTVNRRKRVDPGKVILYVGRDDVPLIFERGEHIEIQRWPNHHHGNGEYNEDE
jgi:hypothetical protein